ncbi:MAG: ATP-binding protein [Solirubrobacterales bacterium]|nr:ATP-binding protein [Solirubrobacterales bacterium]
MSGTTHDGADRASMLVAFRGRNVLSFRDEFELALEATRLSEEDVPREVPWREGGRPMRVLPVAGIFGANASGKSNMLKAMAQMRGFVLHSFKQAGPQTRLPTQPFRLGENDAEPSTYEVEVVLDGVLHVYGFRADSERIVEEWARSYPHGRAVQLLQRDGDDVRLGTRHRARGRATEEILRRNALFLSTAAATAHPLFLPLYLWFQRNLLFADVHSRTLRQGITVKLLEEEGRREQVLELLQEADLGIVDVTRRDYDDELKEKLAKVVDVLRGEDGSGEGDDFEVEDFDVSMKHQAVGGRAVELDSADESWGTVVWFGLIGPVVEALRQGSVLLADELEASLHPLLTGTLVDLFQSKVSNPRRAQLIFNSHEVTLLGDSADRPLGRDQIWFTEKDRQGGSSLYPLADQAPRRGEALGRRYLAGRYGGVPVVSRGVLERIAEPVGGRDG